VLFGLHYYSLVQGCAVKIELFPDHVVRPFKYFGIDNPFFDINLDTVLYTWIALGLLFLVLVRARRAIEADRKTLLALGLERLVVMFAHLCRESIGYFSFEHFGFVASVFLFTLAGTLVGLLPFLEEATKDLNTTLALGLSCFIFVQYQQIREHGFIAYLKEYAQPFIFMLPLEIIGRLASIISMSFRLFGNILGGYIIYTIALSALAPYKMYFMIGSLIILVLYCVVSRLIVLAAYPKIELVFNSLLITIFSLTMTQLFFGLIEGAVQAFVLTMLTITYLAIAVGREEAPSSEVTI
jgi:F-type H+-transporting ATPase subunit a